MERSRQGKGRRWKGLNKAKEGNGQGQTRQRKGIERALDKAKEGDGKGQIKQREGMERENGEDGMGQIKEREGMERAKQAEERGWKELYKETVGGWKYLISV